MNENAVNKDNWRANSETEQTTPPKSYIIFDAHEERTKVLLSLQRVFKFKNKSSYCH